ncbi:hypothetical protein BC940DRAFT_56635 [Gongronella butleri]|nr:hypothetical protein BC940DRAFT_56635 [Gongronella butleri]
MATLHRTCTRTNCPRWADCGSYHFPGGPDECQSGKGSQKEMGGQKGRDPPLVLRRSNGCTSLSHTLTPLQNRIFFSSDVTFYCCNGKKKQDVTPNLDHLGHFFNTFKKYPFYCNPRMHERENRTHGGSAQANHFEKKKSGFSAQALGPGKQTRKQAKGVGHAIDTWCQPSCPRKMAFRWRNQGKWPLLPLMMEVQSSFTCQNS